MTSTIVCGTEVVNYKYDSLNRLIKAYTNDTSQWGLAFDYDGFGNRLSQTVTQGSAPPMTIGVDQTTNRAGSSFDANGNLTSYNNLAMTYDVENRLLAAGTDNYEYAPDNKRVYKFAAQGNNQVESVYYYSGNKKLATYQVVYYNPPGTNQPVRFFFQLTGANIYFGSKLVQAEGQAVVLDRLGSVVWDGAKGAHRYSPYGEERTTTTNETSKFGTYFRDATTGLDYAVSRYFMSSMWRFASPDPLGGSGRLTFPGTWNLFVYSANDPINFLDPLGLQSYGPDDENEPDENGCTWVNGTLNCPAPPEPEPFPTLPASESCSFAEIIDMQCDNTPNSLSSILPIAGRGGRAGMAGAAWGAIAKALGAYGEGVVGKILNLQKTLISFLDRHSRGLIGFPIL